MLNDKDQLLMERLKSENPDFSYLLTKIETEHREILSMISHEIRNPLTLINSSLQLIEAAHPETLTFKFWSQVKEDIHCLRMLLDDLSQFNSAASLQKASLNLNDLAASSAASFASEFESRQMKLLFIPCENLPPISGDPVKLKEILVNLLKNAMEAMTIGGTVTLSITFDSAFVHLHVKDNGCGIPDEHQKDIFLPFKTFKAQGTGLGLSISRQIAAAHGGRLEFISQENRGTTFTLSLPR